MPLFKALPTGTIVGDTDTQTLTNKTIDGNITINSSTGFTTIGASGTGANVAAIIIDGGSAANGGPEIIFRRNGVSKFTIGPQAAIFGNNNDSLTVYNNNISNESLGISSTTGGVNTRGTNTNDSAASGYVGEYQAAAATAVSLVNSTAKTIVSINLTAGDWDVRSQVDFKTAATTNVTYFVTGLSSTTNTRSTAFIPECNRTYGSGQVLGDSAVLGPNSILPLLARVSLSATTTIYLIAQTGFTVSTLTADGYIQARRVR